MVEVRMVPTLVEKTNRRGWKRGYNVERASDGAVLIQPPFPTQKSLKDFVRTHKNYRLVP